MLKRRNSGNVNRTDDAVAEAYRNIVASKKMVVVESEDISESRMSDLDIHRQEIIERLEAIAAELGTVTTSIHIEAMDVLSTRINDSATNLRQQVADGLVGQIIRGPEFAAALASSQPVANLLAELRAERAALRAELLAERAERAALRAERAEMRAERAEMRKLASTVSSVFMAMAE